MTNTKASFASIDTDLLADVQGGCGRRRCRGGCGTRNVNIVNNYAAPAAAPAPAPAAPSSNWSVNVSAGYAQA
jgi:hypothetical protein